MFVERLVAGLSTPQNRLGELDDALVIDVDHHRALLMREARSLSEAGEAEREVAGWAFTCIAEGWVDDHLHTVRDSLIELGAISDQAHLDRLLHAAVLRILGIEMPLPGADALLLDTVTRPSSGPGTLEAEPLGLRLLVRHYAIELGLLFRGAGQTERTPLGDTALRLPLHNLPTYLLALEMLQSAGLGDRWRTPRRALSHMAEVREFDLPTSSQTRRQVDPEGLVPWRRIRRMSLMGLCEAAPNQQTDNEEERCRYRLLPYGEEVLRLVLREPPSEVVRLAQAMLAEQTRQALRPLLVRSRALEALRFARDGAPRKDAPATDLSTRSATMRPAVIVTSPSAPLPAAPMDAKGPAEPPAAEAPPSILASMPPGRPPAEALEDPVSEIVVEMPLPAPEPAFAPLIELAPPVAAEVAEHQAPEPEVAKRASEQPADEAPQAARVIIEVAPEPSQPELEIGSLVQRAWDEIQARKVRFSLQGPPLRVFGDRRALLQALREILRSAADAAQLCPAPMVTVEIQPGDHDAVLLVHDNGPPLSAADRDCLLDASWGLLTEGPRTGLLRAQRVLRSQGLSLQLPAARLGGTTARLQLVRASPAHRAAA